MANNSAHDDIQIIDALPSGVQGNKRKVYDTINALQQARNLGDAEILRTDLHFINHDDTVSVRFYNDQVKVSGWLDTALYQSTDMALIKNNHIRLNQEDYQKIQAGEYRISFEHESDDPHYQVDELLEAMHAYNLGRPSTYAKIIEDMIDNRLFEIRHGQIVPTQAAYFEGLKASQHTQKLGTAEFSVALEKKLKTFIESEQSISSLLYDLVKEICGEDQADAIQALLWESLDDLYQRQAEDCIVGGSITKP